MTEVVKAGGPPVLPGSQGFDRGRKEPMAPAFSEALDEEPAAPAARPEPEAEESRGWRLADRLLGWPKLPQGAPGPTHARNDGGAETKGEDGPTPDPLVPGDVSLQGAETPDPSTTEQFNGKLASSAADGRDTALLPSTVANKQSAGGAELGRHPPANDAMQSGTLPEAATRRALPQDSIPKAEAVTSGPETTVTSPPRAAEGDKASLSSAAARTAIATQSAAAERAAARAGVDADATKSQVRIVSIQSTPAPALPLSTSTTAGALMASLDANADFSTAAAQAAKVITAGQARGQEVLHTLKIQLHPAHLGMVTARLSTSGNQLTVELEVDNADARNKLNADGEAMTRALRALGYEVDRVSIVQQPANGNSAGAGGGAPGRDPGFHTGTGQEQQGGGASHAREDDRGGRQQPTAGQTPEGRKDAAAGGAIYI